MNALKLTATLSSAEKLANALRSMPCTCVPNDGTWPFKPKEIEPVVCRRCVVLKEFDATKTAVTAA